MGAITMITKEVLLEIGKKKGLSNREHIEKDYFQDVMLFNIFKTTNKLIFKGGTALYKLHNLPRFSEDLDFSLLEALSFEAITQIIKKSVNFPANSPIFEVSSIKETKESIMIKIGCKGIITQHNTLRIDINRKNKILNQFVITSYIPSYIDINPFSLRSLSKEEMIAEKIHAILTKEKARHVFDLFYLLRMAKPNKALTKEKLKLFNLNYDKKAIMGKVSIISSVWKSELQPFIFNELPSFEIVKSYINQNLPS